jgi:hypothetical protein
MFLSWLLILIIDQSNASGGTQWPDRCLKNGTNPCVLYVHKKTYFTLEKDQFFFSKDALLEWTGKQQLSLYKGISWMKLAEAAEVDLPFGTLRVAADSELVIDLKDSRAVVSVLSGKVKVAARADKNSYELIEGTEVEMGPVDYQRKVASISLPRTIALPSYLKSIQKAFPFSDFNFQEHLERVGKSIRSGLLLQSKWSQTIVETKMSDDRLDKIRQKYEAEHAQRRDSLLRRIFRQKNNFEEE